MSPGTPARAAASRPNRLVFRPFDARSSANAAASNATPIPPPPQLRDTTTSEKSSQKSARSEDYGIDFELDDDDADAIEEVFTEFEKKLKKQDNEKSPIVVKTILDENPSTSTIPARSFERLLPTQPTQYSSSSSQARVRIEEEAPTEQEEYHDSLALDALLDLEFDDAELLAGLVSHKLPSSQPKPQSEGEGKGKQKSGGTWDSQENWNDEEIDRQVLWEYEEWVKRTGYVEAPGKDKAHRNNR